MNTEPNHDETIDQVLAALRNASPPDSMHARIANRMAQQIASPAPARQRLMSLVPTVSWWRGAITGAAAALLAACAVLLLKPTISPPSAERGTPHGGKNISAQSVAPAAAPETDRARVISVTASAAKPCTSPNPHRVRTSAIASSGTVRETGVAPSHPALDMPLTSQERALVQLAKTVDPKVLASLNSEAQAKMQARNEADFERFFGSQAP